MFINTSTLDSLRVGFKTNFQSGLGMAESQYLRIASVIPSTTAENKYGWLGQMPRMREWIGPRQVKNLSESGYSIENKPFENTIGVKRTHIEDDNLGMYSIIFQDFGQSVGDHPDTLVFEILKNGFTTRCYDGQYFFDTDHPVENADGSISTVSNSAGGSGTPWFLLCTKRPLKPIIFQERKKPQFVAKDDPRDTNVFMNDEFVYGADSRCNVGFGFWQMAHGSRQELNNANYEAARAAIGSFKGDGGRPLGLKPDLLVVPPLLEGKALKVLKNALAAGGETNEWAGTAEVLVVPWLA